MAIGTRFGISNGGNSQDAHVEPAGELRELQMVHGIIKIRNGPVGRRIQAGRGAQIITNVAVRGINLHVREVRLRVLRQGH